MPSTQPTKSCGDHICSVNPARWNYDAKTITTSLTVLVVTLLSITAVALMMHYPNASGAFFAVAGLVATGSFITLIISIVHDCRTTRQYRADAHRKAFETSNNPDSTANTTDV